jgi:hypothetical protein
MRRLVPLIGSLQSLTDHYVTSFFTQPDSPATLPTPHPMYKARVRQLVQHRSRGIAEVILQKKPREITSPETAIWEQRVFGNMH